MEVKLRRDNVSGTLAGTYDTNLASFICGGVNKRLKARLIVDDQNGYSVRFVVLVKGVPVEQVFNGLAEAVRAYDRA